MRGNASPPDELPPMAFHRRRWRTPSGTRTDGNSPRVGGSAVKSVARRADHGRIEVIGRRKPPTTSTRASGKLAVARLRRGERTMAPPTRPGPSRSVPGIMHLLGLMGIVAGVIGLVTLVQSPADAGSAPQAAPSRPATCVSPSGECMPVGDLPGWHQIFTDDFSTAVPLGGFSACKAHNNTILDYHCAGLPASVDAKWATYPDGKPDTSGHGMRYPSKVVSIGNGLLDFYLHNENGTNMDAVLAAKLPGSTAKGGLLGGRYVARFRSDSVYGYKFAWELWPDSGNNFVDGEIEFPSGNLNSTIKAFMHPMNFQGNYGLQSAYHSTASYTAWHTATIEWLPQKQDLKFYLDGVLMGENVGPSVPSTPMHWLLQNETSSDGTIPGPTDAGHIQVDWVAVYAPA